VAGGLWSASFCLDRTGGMDVLTSSSKDRLGCLASRLSALITATSWVIVRNPRRPLLEDSGRTAQPVPRGQWWEGLAAQSEYYRAGMARDCGRVAYSPPASAPIGRVTRQSWSSTRDRLGVSRESPVCSGHIEQLGDREEPQATPLRGLRRAVQPVSRGHWWEGLATQ
jgi:hypothetical protein